MKRRLITVIAASALAVGAGLIAAPQAMAHPSGSVLAEGAGGVEIVTIEASKSSPGSQQPPAEPGTTAPEPGSAPGSN